MAGKGKGPNHVCMVVCLPVILLVHNQTHFVSIGGGGVASGITMVARKWQIKEGKSFCVYGSLFASNIDSTKFVAISVDGAAFVIEVVLTGRLTTNS